MSFKTIAELAVQSREASRRLPTLTTKIKNSVLKDVAKLLVRRQKSILLANNKDLKHAREKNLSAAMIDRLILNENRIHALAQSVLEIAALPDPVGDVIESRKRGKIRIQKVRIPLGVVAMIYESRPNVTIDAAALCFKSGNAVILRGGSEAFHSSQCLVKLFRTVLRKHKLNPNAVTLIPDTDRQSMVDLLQQDSCIDVVIPRGGEGLMRFIAEHTRIPVIKHDKGVCSLFVDKGINHAKAIPLILNAKVQRPGVCNALETLYIHRAEAKLFLPKLVFALNEAGVEVRGDAEACRISKAILAATDEDFATEYLDLILSIKIVRDVMDAIACVHRYSSNHTDGILTSNRKHAAMFTRAVTSSCVVINSSTRFNDGGQLGLGAEIGISTTKLHAYGPMGLNELTTAKYVVESDYAIRTS